MPITPTQQMIRNNYQTTLYLKDHAAEPFSVERLLDVHRLMTEGTLDNASEAGRLRNHDDILVMDGISGDVAHQPPAHDEIPALMADLERFFNSDDEAPSSIPLSRPASSISCLPLNYLLDVSRQCVSVALADFGDLPFGDLLRE